MRLKVHDKYWIGFSAIEQLDSRFIQRLYNYFGNIEIAFNASLKELSQIEGLSVKKAETFLKERDKIDLDKTFSTVQNRGIKYLTFDDNNYPQMLKQIENPPIVLYYKGDLSVCNFEKTLAVVGSRKASFAAKDSLKYLISGLKNTDICIVSGLASGIDSVAHLSALENGLKTIGVIASGFDYTYPASNKALYDNIQDGNGVIFSEYFPTFEPLKFRFPQRNRIVTGLSYGTLVAEASLKSGALISANLTLEQGRELMCIPGVITNPNTEGIYKLLKQGASLITSTDDILEALGWEIKKEESVQLSFNDLSEEESSILSFVEIEEKGFDEIQNNTNINTDELLTYLTIMELKGIIEKVNGDRYRKTRG